MVVLVEAIGRAEAAFRKGSWDDTGALLWAALEEARLERDPDVLERLRQLATESSFESEDWPPSGPEWEEPTASDDEPTTLEPSDEDASGRVVIQHSTGVSFYDMETDESADPLDSLPSSARRSRLWGAKS